MHCWRAPEEDAFDLLGVADGVRAAGVERLGAERFLRQGAILPALLPAVLPPGARSTARLPRLRCCVRGTVRVPGRRSPNCRGIAGLFSNRDRGRLADAMNRGSNCLPPAVGTIGLAVVRVVLNVRLSLRTVDIVVDVRIAIDVDVDVVTTPVAIAPGIPPTLHPLRRPAPNEIRLDAT